MSHDEAQNEGRPKSPRAERLEVDRDELDATMRREKEELEKTWARPTGLRGWFTDTDHKSIAKRYIVTAFVFFIFGGIEAALMRIQLMRPDRHFLSPDQYNQIFTVHGTTMMFLFAVPIMTAMGIYFVPLMIGARNVAFPRLNAFGYWTYLVGVVFLYVSLLKRWKPSAVQVIEERGSRGDPWDTTRLARKTSLKKKPSA